MIDDENIIELQSRLAFQEDLLQETAQQLAKFAAEWRESQVQIRELNKRIRQLEEFSDMQGRGETNEIPPHY